KVGTITGVVNLAGKPIEGGLITFQTRNGEGEPVTTNIQMDGTFTAINVPFGELVIGVQPVPPGDTTTSKPTNPSAPQIAPAKPGWVTRYSDPLTSGLTFTLTNEQAQHTIQLLK
ncbi:MAG: hypothetical protein ACRCZF_16480, partial [Gemmataceae bacterium]